jgi:PST family polysaccharide transporter
MTPEETPLDLAVSNAEQDGHFGTDQLKKDLGRRTARGGAVTFVSQSLKFFLNMATTVVLARLLTPEDYGIIGMVAVVTGFVSMFKDLGLSAATVQREEINAAQVSTLFWINVALSIVVMVVTVALAPGVAWFYHEPRLRLVTMAYAIGFLVGGLAVQHEALLRRQMRFTALAVLEIVSLAVGIVTAIVLGWYGAHYWALVASQLALGLTGAVGVWIICDWRPGWPVRDSGVGSMLAFGRNLTGFTIVNYFARNLDNMLIGKFWGSQQLGNYAKAYQLLLLPIEQINSPVAAVAIPALSRLNDTTERYRQAYIRLLEKVAVLTIPGVAFMIGTSDWLVRIALGPNWTDAGRIFAVLGIAGLIQPIANTTGWLFISQGRARDMFRWGMIGSAIIVASILAGLPWGAIGVAVSYSSTYVIVVAPLLFWFVGRSGPVRQRDFYSTMFVPALAAFSVLAVLITFRKFVPIGQPIFGVAIGLGLSVLVSLLVVIAFPSGRKTLFDFKTTLTLLLSGSR